MKKLLIILSFITQTTFAQFIFPELSPQGTIHQEIGYTKVDIRYGRPAARTRKIMNGLVPYKKLWRF